MLFNETLKKLRVTHNLTQQQIADSIGVHVTTYSHYESGNRFPKKEILDKILSVYPSWKPSLLAHPVETTMIFPKELLDNLEQVLSKIDCISENYGTAKDEYSKIKSALTPVLDLRAEFLDLPDCSNITSLPSGTTTKIVHIDIRAEMLIEKAIRLQNSFWDIRFR